MENLKKKAKCWLVTTDNKENALKGYKDKSLLFEFKPKYYEGSKIITEFTQHYHLYITSNEEIKEGNYAYHRLDNKPILVTKDLLNGDIRRFGYSKVVISTDKSLNLPQPSQGFINAYIEAYNKGQKIINVMVEYETRTLMKPHDVYNETVTYIKTDSNNCATITKAKTFINVSELENLLIKHYLDAGTSIGLGQDVKQFTKNWMEQNL